MTIRHSWTAKQNNDTNLFSFNYRLVFEGTPNDNTTSSSSSSSNVPQLAFNSLNRPIKEYEETLLKFLTELDEIESHNSDHVKKNRKNLAVALQGELDRVDELKSKIWEKQSSSPFSKTVEKVEEKQERKEDGDIQLEQAGEVQQEEKVTREIDQSASEEVEKATSEGQAEEAPHEAATEHTEAEPAANEVTPDFASEQAATVQNTPEVVTEEAPVEQSDATPESDEQPQSESVKVSQASTEPHAHTAAENDSEEKKADDTPVKSEERAPISHNIEITSETDATSSSPSPSSVQEESDKLHQPSETHSSPKPTYAEIVKAKLAAAEEEAARANETEEKKSIKEDKKEDQILFEVESVSSEASNEHPNDEQLQKEEVSLVENAKSSDKSTTVSDEEDDVEDGDSESSFEMIQ